MSPFPPCPAPTSLAPALDSTHTNWRKLRLWRDLNRDDISQANELLTLSSRNIAALNVATTEHRQRLANRNPIAHLGRLRQDRRHAGHPRRSHRPHGRHQPRRQTLLQAVHRRHPACRSRPGPDAAKPRHLHQSITGPSPATSSPPRRRRRAMATPSSSSLPARIPPTRSPATA